MKMQANTTLFFYQNGKITTVSEKGRPRTIFRADDQPLAEQHAGDAGTPGLLATDDKGSVLTVQNNDEEEDPRFTPYGHDADMRTGKLLLGFNGEPITPSIECYLLGSGYRSYAPHLMRFLSPDSLSPFGAGGLNAYAYCSNDPVNLVDPSGHSFIKGVKNFLFGRKQNKLDRINNFNQNMSDRNTTLNKLKETQLNHSNTDINALESNIQISKKLARSPAPTITEKDKLYALKHGIELSAEDIKGARLVDETDKLALIHDKALKERQKIRQEIKAEASDKARKIRQTTPSDPKSGFDRLFGKNHTHNRYDR